MSWRRFLAFVLAVMMSILPALAVAEKNNADAYRDAVELLQDNMYTEAANAFAAIGNYSDAAQLAMYSYAIAAGESGAYSTAITNLQTLGAFRDSALLVTYYQGRAYESKEEYETAQDVFAGMTFFKDVAGRVASYPEKINARDYAKADAAEQGGQLDSALRGFTALGLYLDSADRAAAVQVKIDARQAAADEAARATAETERAAAYAAADQAEAGGDFASAYTGFTSLGDYRDSADRALALHDRGSYALGMKYALSGQFSNAYPLFAELAERGYEDSEEKAYLLGVTGFASVADKGNGIGIFRFHDLFGLINVNTNTTIAPVWDQVGDFNELGLAAVKKDGKYGYINAQGREVIACEWLNVSAFSGGYCTVAAETADHSVVFGMLDQWGNVLTDAQWETMGDSHSDRQYYDCNAPVFSQGLMKVKNRKGEWGFIDKEGKTVGSIEWNEIRSFVGGFAIVVKDGQYGYIDAAGNVVIQPAYKDAHTFSEGLAAVQEGDKWQFINQEGKVVIRPLYTEVTDFSGGTADVYLPGTGWQIIDKTGALLYFVDNRLATDYRSAVDLMAEGQYDKAYELLVTLPSYKDSDTLAETCLTQIKGADYAAAMALFTAGQYSEAYEAFTALDGYQDAADQAAECVRLQKEADYTAAMALFTAGQYSEAYEAFTALAGYKDVDTLLTTDSNLLAARSDYCRKVGHIITYGHYEQDNNMENGQEAIEWIVLDYDAAKNRVLLLSRYGLDARRFDAEKYQGWSKSELRTWLNSDFLNAAFTPEEQANIMLVQIKTPANGKVKGGADTKDQIWLLSNDEATQYFNTNSGRMTTATAYARANGAYEDVKGNCLWWLRSPEGNGNSASTVYTFGNISFSVVSFASEVVRPAFWLDLSSL